MCPTHTIFLPSIGGFINRKAFELSRAGPGRAVGIERVEDIGPESGIWGRKILLVGKFYRRLTSPLAATLRTVAVSEERGTGNDFSRRFRVRQIERLLLRNLRSPESVGIPVRARVESTENRSPIFSRTFFFRIRRQRMVVPYPYNLPALYRRFY